MSSQTPSEKPGLSEDTARALAVLLAAVGQIITAQLPFLFNWPKTVADRAFELEHLLIPQTYAFSIWGVIFLWSLGLSWWHWKHRETPVARQAGWLIAGAFVCNTVWQVWVPMQSLDPISLALSSGGLLLALTAALRFPPLAAYKWQRLLFHGPVWLMTGWLTAAAFVNLASLMVWTGEAFRPTREEVAVVFLGGLILFAAFITVMGRSALYTAAVVWALVAIGIANAYDNRALLWGEAGLGVIVLLLLLFSVKIRGVNPTPPSDLT